jgi:hypothetical protein
MGLEDTLRRLMLVTSGKSFPAHIIVDTHSSRHARRSNMDVSTLTTFFGWCTVVNLGLLLLWGGAWMLVPDFVYRSQTKFFAVPRPQFELLFYGFLGLFKIFFLVFNLVPYVALVLMGGAG